MGARRPKVLIVEDDDALALSLHRALYKNNNRFDVIAVKTGEVGREIMREMLIDVLVVDWHLPGISGLDLVYWAAVESPETHFVVISGSDLNLVRNRASAAGCLRVLPKPLDGAMMLQAVIEALDSRERLSGQLSALSAVDLIQMLCLGRKSVSVRITASENIGILLVKEGSLVHAIWGDSVGEDAVREIVGVSDGVFRTAPLPNEFDRTIHRDWTTVVMDAVVHLDEQQKQLEPATSGTWPTIRPDSINVDELFQFVSGSKPPGAESEPIRPSDPTALRAKSDPVRAAAALVDKGFAALRAGDLSQARMCWEAAQRLEPDNRSIELNLRKLDSIRGRSMG